MYPYKGAFISKRGRSPRLLFATAVFIAAVKDVDLA